MFPSVFCVITSCSSATMGIPGRSLYLPGRVQTGNPGGKPTGCRSWKSYLKERKNKVWTNSIGEQDWVLLWSSMLNLYFFHLFRVQSMGGSRYIRIRWISGTLYQSYELANRVRSTILRFDIYTVASKLICCRAGNGGSFSATANRHLWGEEAKCSTKSLES